MAQTLNVRHRQWQAHIRRQKANGYKVTRGALRDHERWTRRGNWKERMRTRFNRLGEELHRPGMSPMYYDRAGKPIGWGDQMLLHSDYDYRRVAEDYIGPYRVSTVWLGMDHSHGYGPPLIFETMIFGAGGAIEGGLAGETWRYETEEEAGEGHARVCALVQLELDVTKEDV